MEFWITKDSDGIVEIWNKCPTYNERYGLWVSPDDETGITVTDIEFFNKSLKRGERRKIWRIW